MSNYTPSKVWDEITNPFPNVNGRTVKVWELKDSFISYIIMEQLHIHAGIKLNPY